MTIQVSESRNGSVITPLVGATSTYSMNIATCSDIYSMYTWLVRNGRALEAWFPTPIAKAVAMDRRRIRSSFSTSSWDAPCGWSCPILWRSIRGMKGMGAFRWGGNENQHRDTVSTVGVPDTDNDIKWRLGDTCNNKHCALRKGHYFKFVRPF
jgi:hypothetical protein